MKMRTKINGNRVTINAILNVIKTVMSMLFPLITFPYISRILGVENVGIISYSSSIVTYFVLFSLLGIDVYAIREGAKLRSNKDDLNQFVSEVFSINFISSMVSLFLLILLVSKGLATYRLYILILGIEIPLAFIGSDWINCIFEDYLYISVRTILFQFLSLVLMFTLVKQSTDLIPYTICILLASRGSELLNAFYIKRYCKRSFTYRLNFKRHLKPILLLFAVNLTSAIYSNCDLTMLGILTNDYHVGIYSTAGKIFSILKRLLFAAVAVCLPRFSLLVEGESRERCQYQAQIIHKVLFMLVIPMILGICILSTPVIVVIAGNDFLEAASTLSIKSFALLFAVFGYFYMQIVLIPARKDRVVLFSTLSGMIINIVLNYILIPLYNENGAAVATVLSEMIVYLICRISSNDIMKMKIEFKFFFDVMLSTFIMSIFVILIRKTNLNVFLQIIIAGMGGVSIYFCLLMLMKNQIILFALTNFSKKRLTK